MTKEGIQHAQMIAGENAVIEGLRRKGLLPPTPPTPAGAGTETKDRIHVLVDELYTAYCDYKSRQQNKDRFRNLVTDFLNAELTSLRRQAEADRAEKERFERLLDAANKRWDEHFDGHQAEVDTLIALRAQLASVDKDRERLDWLEKNWPDIVGRSDRRGVVITHDDFSTELGRGKNYRAAIDAALQPTASLDHGARGANQDKQP